MGGDPIRAGFVLHFPPERQEQAIRFCQIVGVGIPDLVEKRSYSSALHPLNRPRRTDRAAPADGRLGPPENTEPESPPPPGTSLGEVVGVGAAGEFAPADQVLVTHSDPQVQVLSPDNPDGNPQSSDPRTTLGINRPLLRHPPPSGPMSTAATKPDVSRQNPGGSVSTGAHPNRGVLPKHERTVGNFVKTFHIPSFGSPPGPQTSSS